MLPVSLPKRGVNNNIIPQPIFFNDFFVIGHKQITSNFVKLSVKEYVNYKQCFNSLQTALVLKTCMYSLNLEFALMHHIVRNRSG